MNPMSPVIAALALAAGSAIAQEPLAEPARVPPGVRLVPVAAPEAPSRAAVRDEYLRARADGTLTPEGEAGDTPAVLAAREQAHQQQHAAWDAVPDRLAALAAARAAATRMSGPAAVDGADVYEMQDERGELVGFLFVVE